MRMGDFVDKIKGSNTDTTTSLKGERNETIPLGCTNITPFLVLSLSALEAAEPASEQEFGK